MPLHGKDMFPEIIELNIKQELNNFENKVFKHLLPRFNTITEEARHEADSYKKSKEKNFNPDYNDEGNIEDSALSIELIHIEQGERSKQAFLNQCAVELFHILENSLKKTWNSSETPAIRNEIIKNNYDICKCIDWTIINKHLRTVANTIKHGPKSDAAKNLAKLCPNMLEKNQVIVSEQNIKVYLESMREFWRKALDKRIIK